ncbi:hypothetical protein ABL78_5180 [Leptomonas seymouri]|uniref:Uncharacterized protein n=1 Tax=Leptomonas seymouri TaxID=5684 RepID=A0A0N1PCL2_LEPSE|nr:hypothetical protein ABL78_5180 [Leptomonas seymouri]|eukprot:KPI85762.1 hypothetical protein ABL78_5180 [Leptomonas seymouri]
MMEPRGISYAVTPPAMTGQRGKAACPWRSDGVLAAGMLKSFLHRCRTEEHAAALRSPQGFTSDGDEGPPSRRVLQKLLLIADASVPMGEVQWLCEEACDTQDKMVWSWWVRLGCVLSVATALSAVYVRCGVRPPLKLVP